MKARFTRAAEEDLSAIFQYLAEHRRSAAEDFLNAVETTLRRLEEHPRSARETEWQNIRMVPIGRFPYLLFYELTADEIQIWRVLHGARSRPWEEQE